MAHGSTGSVPKMSDNRRGAGRAVCAPPFLCRLERCPCGMWPRTHTVGQVLGKHGLPFSPGCKATTLALRWHTLSISEGRGSVSVENPPVRERASGTP